MSHSPHLGHRSQASIFPDDVPAGAEREAAGCWHAGRGAQREVHRPRATRRHFLRWEMRRRMFFVFFAFCLAGSIGHLALLLFFMMVPLREFRLVHSNTRKVIPYLSHQQVDLDPDPDWYFRIHIYHFSGRSPY